MMCRWHGLVVCSCGNVLSACRCFVLGEPPKIIETREICTCGADAGKYPPRHA